MPGTTRRAPRLGWRRAHQFGPGLHVPWAASGPTPGGSDQSPLRVGAAPCVGGRAAESYLSEPSGVSGSGPEPGLGRRGPCTRGRLTVLAPHCPLPGPRGLLRAPHGVRPSGKELNALECSGQDRKVGRCPESGKGSARSRCILGSAAVLSVLPLRVVRGRGEGWLQEVNGHGRHRPVN